MDGFANFFSETAYDNFPPEIANLIKTGNFNATQIRYLKKFLGVIQNPLRLILFMQRRP